MDDELRVEEKDGKMEVSAAPAEAPDIKEYLPLSGFLGISEPSQEEADQLKVVWDYFKGEGKSNAEILYAIREAENSMQPPRLGESRIHKIYNYAKVRSVIEDNKKLLNSL